MKTALVPLALACLLAALPAAAQVNYAVSGNAAYVDRSPNASGDIVIASTFNGFPVTSIEVQAFNGCGSLTSVTIPNSVTNIGAEGFYFCTSLTNVILGNGVTAIGFYVFRDCRSLTSVTIPNSVTAVGYGAFQNCTSLTSMILPDSVTYIDQVAFYNCTSLTNVILGNSVASIGLTAFYNCTALTSVTLPHSVTNIAALAFSGCTNVTNFSVDAANPAFSSLNGVMFNKAQTTLINFPPARGGSYVIPGSVTNIGGRAFENCTSLTSVTIPNGVISIGGAAFYRCTSLTSVTIPDSVTQIGTTLYAGGGGSAFAFCTSLTNVIIGHSVTNIGSGAFSACSNLTRLTIPASVVNLGYAAFLGSSRLTNFTFLGNAPTRIFDMDGGFAQFQNVGAGAKVYYYCGNTGWGATYGGLPTVMLCSPQVNYAVSGNTAYVASSPNASGDIVIASTYNDFPVTSIGIFAFAGTTNLTSVTIPNSVTSISSYAFTNCTSLTSVTIPNSVTHIGDYAFSRCTSLNNVTIGNSVTNTGYQAFRSCTSLTSVMIPHSVTSIGRQPFELCTSLTNLSVDAANPVYSSFDGVLFDKAQTTLITFPPGRRSYVMPHSVINIANYAFSQCTGLTNVTIGNSVTSIGGSAFSLCTSLTSVTFGKSVANIGENAFLGCGSLKRVTIPNSVTSIGRDAFIACTSLTNFTFLGNAPQLTAFDGRTFSIVGAGAKAYYYCGTIGWGATYGELPTVMLCPPQVAPGSAGVKPDGFGFTLTRFTNQTIVVEASIDLLNWQPIWTNTLPGASAEFVDPEGLPFRFYRARPE